LPKVARTLGHLWGRAQRYINGVKADISRDMALDELKQLREKVQQEADNLAQATRSVSQNIDQQVRGLNADVSQMVAAESTPKVVAPEQQKLPIN
jgi:sec-independent protein translocase protein TatB